VRQLGTTGKSGGARKFVSSDKQLLGAVVARSASDEAIQNLAAARLDCFASVRNDGLDCFAIARNDGLDASLSLAMTASGFR